MKGRGEASLLLLHHQLLYNLQGKERSGKGGRGAQEALPASSVPSPALAPSTCSRRPCTPPRGGPPMRSQYQPDHFHLHCPPSLCGDALHPPSAVPALSQSLGPCSLSSIPFPPLGSQTQREVKPRGTNITRSTASCGTECTVDPSGPSLPLMTPTTHLGVIKPCGVHERCEAAVRADVNQRPATKQGRRFAISQLA